MWSRRPSVLRGQHVYGRVRVQHERRAHRLRAAADDALRIARRRLLQRQRLCVGSRVSGQRRRWAALRIGARLRRRWSALLRHRRMQHQSRVYRRLVSEPADHARADGRVRGARRRHTYGCEPPEWSGATTNSEPRTLGPEHAERCRFRAAPDGREPRAAARCEPDAAAADGRRCAATDELDADADAARIDEPDASDTERQHDLWWERPGLLRRQCLRHGVPVVLQFSLRRAAERRTELWHVREPLSQRWVQRRSLRDAVFASVGEHGVRAAEPGLLLLGSALHRYRLLLQPDRASLRPHRVVDARRYADGLPVDRPDLQRDRDQRGPAMLRSAELQLGFLLCANWQSLQQYE